MYGLGHVQMKRLVFVPHTFFADYFLQDPALTTVSATQSVHEPLFLAAQPAGQRRRDCGAERRIQPIACIRGGDLDRLSAMDLPYISVRTYIHIVYTTSFCITTVAGGD